MPAITFRKRARDLVEPHQNIFQGIEIRHQTRHLEGTVRPLVKRGIMPAENGWGGWLGRYQAALAKAAVSIQRDALKERHRQPQAR